MKNRQEAIMNRLKLALLSGIAALALAAAVPQAEAQINIQIGVEPVCPYGYFNYAPYSCAPFGYYGPQWFNSGVFVGAGQWFHGPAGFYGYVNRDYDPHYGYSGPLPKHGEHADWGRHNGWEKQFRGNERRVEQWHDNGNHNGQYKEHGNPHENGNGNGKGKEHKEDHGNGHGHD
jgi:hypothetical protein